MVRTATPNRVPAAPLPTTEDEIRVQAAAIMARVDTLARSIENVSSQNDANVKRLESRLESLSTATERRFSDFDISVREAVRDGVEQIQQVVASSRGDGRQLDDRLGQIETRQADMVTTLDTRLHEMAYQARLAMVGGGLIVVAAIVVMLLR